MLLLTLWLGHVLKQWMTLLQMPDLRAILVNPFLNNNYRILFLIHSFMKYFTRDCYQPYRRQRGIFNLPMGSLRTIGNKTNSPLLPWSNTPCEYSSAITWDTQKAEITPLYTRAAFEIRHR